MRKLAAFFTAYLLALGQAQGAVTFNVIGSKAEGSGSTTNVFSTTADIVAGKPFFVVVAGHGNSTITSVATSAGDSLTLLGTQNTYGSTGGRAGIYWIASPTSCTVAGSCQITVTYGISSAQCAVAFQAATIPSTFSLDGTGTGTGTNGALTAGVLPANAHNGLSLTTQPATLISYFVVDTGFAAGTHPTVDTTDGWTGITDITIASGVACSAQFQNVTSTTAVKYQNPGAWGSGSNQWGVNQMGFDTPASSTADQGDLGPMTGATQ